MAPQRWYRPVERGLEAKIRAKLEHLRELDAQAQRRLSLLLWPAYWGGQALILLGAIRAA